MIAIKFLDRQGRECLNEIDQRSVHCQCRDMR